MSTLSAEKMSETELDSAVWELTRDFGLFARHVPDSRVIQGTKGFPDWEIIGPRGILWRENKNEFERPTAEQRHVGYLLTMNGQKWGIWRPSDLLSGLIRRELLALV